MCVYSEGAEGNDQNLHEVLNLRVVRGRGVYMRNKSLSLSCLAILFIQDYYSSLQTVVVLHSGKHIVIGPWGPLYLASIWGKRIRIVLKRFLNVPSLELATYHLGSHFFQPKLCHMTTLQGILGLY